ncbi:MAG: hypothetical protein KF819_39735 [Labilithrix sp.]|nr:hypothetical protein [Labilithrix sp.]
MAIARNRWVIFGISMLVWFCGCASGPSSVPIAPSSPWIDSLLGGPSHVSIVARPSAFMHDRYWGPALQRTIAKSKRDDLDETPPDQLAAFFQSSQLEAFVGVRDFARLERAPRDQINAETINYVLVVRGLPPVDPLRLTTKRGDPQFSAPARLASGVLEYPPSPPFVRRKQGLATWLYVMPDGTWVGVDQVTAQRARGIYSQTGTAPPPMRMESEHLFAAFVDRWSVEAATKRAEARDETWRRDLTAGGLILHGGRDGAIEIVLDYASDAAADRAKDWTGATLQATCQKHELACLLVKTAIRDVKLAQDGRRFGITFFLSELLLQRLSEGS